MCPGIMGDNIENDKAEVGNRIARDLRVQAILLRLLQIRVTSIRSEMAILQEN